MVYCQFFLVDMITIREGIMKRDYHKLEKDIIDIILLCQLEISDKREGIASESNITQIKNVIVPEMESLLAAIHTNSAHKYIGKRLSSAWYVMDTWDFDSVLGKKILSLNNDLN